MTTKIDPATQAAKAINDAGYFADTGYGDAGLVANDLVDVADIIRRETGIHDGGTIHERHMRLLGIAKVMGFTEADTAYWYEPETEYGHNSLKDATDDMPVGESAEYEIGLYLHQSIHVSIGDDGYGSIEVETHDTADEAQQAAERKLQE